MAAYAIPTGEQILVWALTSSGLVLGALIARWVTR